MIGQPIHHHAARILESRGAITSGFAARQLTPKIANAADLLITMTTEHRDSVLAMVPRQLRRTFTLVEAARLATELGAQTIADLPSLRPHLAMSSLPDVPDPIGENTQFFAEVASRIALLLEPVIELCARTANS